jgi:hypothetical protein
MSDTAPSSSRRLLIVSLSLLAVVVSCGTCATWLVGPSEPVTEEERAAMAVADSVQRARADSALAVDDPAEFERQRVQEEFVETVGLPPTGSASIRSAVADVVRLGAHNPRSIDVERCSEPAMDIDAKRWVVDCEFYGQNAFGAEIVNRGRFEVRQREGGAGVFALPVE